MQSDHLSKVPDLEKRRELDRLHRNLAAAQAELTAAEEQNSEAINAKFQPLLDEAVAAYRKRTAELESQKAAEGGTDLTDLKDKVEAAELAYNDFEAPAIVDVVDDDTGEYVPQRCALTGLVLFEDDPVMTDEETGEKVLKVALGVPLDDDGTFLKPEEPAKAAA